MVIEHHFKSSCKVWHSSGRVHLLANGAEVLLDVFHAASLQLSARVRLGEAVNTHAVHLVHLSLHEPAAGLPHRHHVQQIGGRQERLHVSLGDHHLGRVGVAHQHANHLGLHSIDGHPLLTRLHQVCGEHGLHQQNTTTLSTD